MPCACVGEAGRGPVMRSNPLMSSSAASVRPPVFITHLDEKGRSPKWVVPDLVPDRESKRTAHHVTDWDLMRDGVGTVANVSGKMKSLRLAFAEVGAG